ncbi:MAG: hypothetical protein MK086_04985 [Flavobacteriales bacterium]|nr:hypothetical protein [Flavobacteriales bacterium]
MLDYLFLVPLSPCLEEESLRGELQKLCFNQIGELTCSYEVWLLGGQKTNQENFKTISCKGISKEDKLKEVGDLLIKENRSAKYLVRLDDDDLINPKVFDSLASQQFDVAYDKMHFFYDLATGMSTQQERSWIPNTAILNYHEALTKVKAIGGSKAEDGMNYLFACDHSQAWHPYFEASICLHPLTPLYVRILNPSSITAAEKGDFSEKNYFRYLQGFGTWKAQLPDSMLHLANELQKIRQKYLGPTLKFKPKNSFLRRFL